MEEEERRKRLRRNIVLIQAMRSCKMMLFGITVNVTYFQALGVSMWGVFMIKAVHSMGTLLLEVPSGIFSDTFGRQPALLISNLSSGLYWFFMGFAWSDNPVGMLAATQVFLAIGDSFFSGTDKAVLYESIHELGELDEALKGESHAVYYSQVTESIASVFGGYIASYVSLRAAIQVTALPYVVGCVLTLLLLETMPPRHSSEGLRVRAPLNFQAVRQVHAFCLVSVAMQLARIMLGCCVFLHNPDRNPTLRQDLANPVVWGLMCVLCLLGVSTYMAVWFYQPLWARAELPLEYYGWSWAALNLSVAFSALGAVHFERWLGVWVCCVVASLTCIACYINLALWTHPATVTLAGCALNSLRGAFFPIMTTEVNRALPSERRATVLSIKGLGYNVLFSSFSQLAGYVANTAGLTWACLLTGHCLGGSALICTVVVHGAHMRYQALLLEKGARGADDTCGEDSQPPLPDDAPQTTDQQQPLLADASKCRSSDC